MEVRFAMAKTKKYSVSHSGDNVEFTERPHGGITAILADGQGSGLAGNNTSRLVIAKASSLISEGTRDGAAARAVHDYLYTVKNGRVSCTLTLLSADMDSQTLLISRNSNCPTIVKTDDYLTVYDESVNPIGVHRHTKPLIYELPLSENMVVVSYTDGIQSAGTKYSNPVDFAQLQRIIEQNSAEDVQYIADSILDCALTHDKNMPGDDMTVVVMGITGREVTNHIRRLSLSYPY